MAHVVINDTTPRATFAVTVASSGPFAIGFAVFDPSTDLKVYNGSTLLTYSASPANASQWGWTGTLIDGGYNGGEINLGGTVTNTTIVVLRDIPIARTSDFAYPAGTLNTQGLNTQLDKLFAIKQDDELRFERTLRQPPSDATLISEMPAAAIRASKFLAFDASGNPIVAAGTSANLGPVSSYVDGFLSAANEAAFKAYVNLEAGVDFAGIVTLTAGAGLTGGGDLSASRSFAVGAGTGIVANADDVAIDKATEANMEAQTSNKVATADNMKWHPGVAKAWANVSGGGTPALAASHNISSVTDNGVGDYTLNFTTPFASAVYVPIGSVREDSDAGPSNSEEVRVSEANAPTASACRVHLRVNATLSDAFENWYIAFFGTQ